MMSFPHIRYSERFWLVIILLLVAAIYWPGLSGGWLFDDYLNIVYNQGLQITNLHLSTLINAALSSAASEFKRPLAMLSFALNYRATGLDPYWMKLTNVVIHLLNGLLVFVLTRALIQQAGKSAARTPVGAASAATADSLPIAHDALVTEVAPTAGIVAVLVAAAWMLLPINLTGVLYVVQRMESLANLFVLLGLIGYVAGRRRMLAGADADADAGGLALCAASLVVTTALGLLAKETAVMLPLYALLIEWALFRGMRKDVGMSGHRHDWRIAALFLIVLVLPMLLGLGWLLPGLLKPEAWAARDFTLRTRLLSEARIVLDYIHWTLLPSPRELSFYHDDFVISSGWLAPWTTLASVLGLAALTGLSVWLRRRAPLAALGLALFLGCHLLTGTILPLELIYEHRNYFASFGLMLALVPLLAAPATSLSFVGATSVATSRSLEGASVAAEAAPTGKPRANDALPYATLRRFALGVLLVFWASQTALTARAWGSPLRLTQMLAAVAPDSPRAQYDLGRSYSVYTNYDPASPFTPLAFAALEHAASMSPSTILPEQALIFMSAKMKLPIKEAWWDSLIAKLKAHPISQQDLGAVTTLSTCAAKNHCALPIPRMLEMFLAALDHPNPSAELQAHYGDYAWSVMGDRALGERMTAAAVAADPGYPGYRVALIRMLAAQGRSSDANSALHQLEALNVGGRLDPTLRELRALPGMR
ncbi:MAG: hypothetical protein ACREPQ_11355 [Rhodanobacter sp.]